MSDVTRRGVLAGGLAGFASALAARMAFAQSADPAAKLPNILCFVSEDNTTLIGAYGDKLAHTPTIDALAASGVRFDRAYATSPVCGPSRFALITGMYQSSAGTADDFGSTDDALSPEVRGLPQYLKDIGYFTTNADKTNYQSQLDFVQIWDESSPKAHWRHRPKGAPFFSIINTFTTHESCLFTKRPKTDTVKPADVTLPSYLPDTPGVRSDFAKFYNAMEYMDGEFAKALAELEEDGLTEDTIVIYYSDNGGITPRGKRYLYETGTRCPLIIRFPQKWQHLSPHAPGSVVEEPVSFVDIPATILSLAALDRPDYMHGRALAGKDASEKGPGYAFSTRSRMDERYDLSRAVTDGRWRYIRNYNPHRPWGQHVDFMFQADAYKDWEAAHVAGTLDDKQSRFWGRKPYEELYDVQSDPDQVNDLASNPDHADKRAELAKALDEHMVRIGDTGFIPEGLALKDWKLAKLPGAYPLDQIMPLAAMAAGAPADHFDDLLAALDHDHDVMRYWGAMGFLIAGDAAKPYVDQLTAKMRLEKAMPARITLAEILAVQADSEPAVIMLGEMLDREDDGPFRLQAINALTYIGDRAKLVLPAIRRSSQEEHRHMRKAGGYLVQVLEGTYDPKAKFTSPGGHVQLDATKEFELETRPYD